MQIANERYSKEKAAEYYLKNKEVIKEKSNNEKEEKEEKEKIKDYRRKRY